MIGAAPAQAQLGQSNAYIHDRPSKPSSHVSSLGETRLGAPAASQYSDNTAILLDGVSKRKADGLAAAPGQPAKPDLGWMGRGDERAPPPVIQENRDKFDAREINPVKQVASEPVSTFSIDVDTASYAFARRALNAGHLPPKDSCASRR